MQNSEVYIKPWFLLQNVLKSLHLERFMFLLKWKAENVCRKCHCFVVVDELQQTGMVTSSSRHLCTWSTALRCVRFPIALNKIDVLRWWLGRVTLAIVMPVMVAQTHTKQMLLMCVPPSLWWQHLLIPSHLDHVTWIQASFRLPRSTDTKVSSFRSRSCWISLPTLHHHDHFPW